MRTTAFPASKFDPDIHIPLDLPERRPEPSVAPAFLEVRDFNFFYPKLQALHSISMKIPKNRVTAFIGPSGCGKTTMLRSFNRMNDLIPGCRSTGEILLGGENIFDRKLNLMNLRRCVGLVFQKSNPFPRTIYENIACVVRVGGPGLRKVEINEQVEQSLRLACLWDDVKDRLNSSALDLSGGQMQRLCLARAIACNPQVLLLDEPCSSLDPSATAKIEQLIGQLARQFTIVLVTHNLGQASRCADQIGFFYQGRLIEYRPADDILLNPIEKQTLAYFRGTVW